MSSRHVLLAILVLAPVTLCQSAEKQAVAAVKAAAKERLAEYKAAGKAALQLLDSDLEALEAGLDENTTAADFAGDVSGAAIELLVTMRNAWAGALQLVASASTSAIGELADGGDLAGIYPESLYVGTDGALDDARKALLKAASKVRDAATRRLAKCAALAEKHAGLALAVRLRIPAAFVARISNQGNNLVMTESARFDLLLSVSALDTANDGVLVVSGFSDSAGDATVGWIRGAGQDDEQVVAPGGGRFTATFTGLMEGGYGVSVEQGTAPNDDVADIGVR